MSDRKFPDFATPIGDGPAGQAALVVRQARQDVYGHPLDNHERMARLFNARLYEKLADPLRDPITAEDCVSLLRLMKESRLMQSPGHEDSLVDIAGYADLEWEMHRERERRAAVDPFDSPACRGSGGQPCGQPDCCEGQAEDGS